MSGLGLKSDVKQKQVEAFPLGESMKPETTSKSFLYNNGNQSVVNTPNLQGSNHVEILELNFVPVVNTPNLQGSNHTMFQKINVAQVVNTPNLQGSNHLMT